MSFLLTLKKCCCNPSKCYYQLLPCDNQAPDGPGPLCPNNVDCCDHTPDPPDKRYIVLCEVAENLNSATIDMNPWCVPLLTLDTTDGPKATNCYCWNSDSPIVEKNPDTDIEVTGEDLQKIFDNCPDCCCNSGFCTGACCQGETCTITTRADCIDAGGLFLGEDTDCSPATGNPCLFDCGTCATTYVVNVTATVTTIANNNNGCQSTETQTLSATTTVQDFNGNCQWDSDCGQDICPLGIPGCLAGTVSRSMTGECMSSACIQNSSGCPLGESVCHSVYMVVGDCLGVNIDRPQPAVPNIRVSFKASAAMAGSIYNTCNHCGEICDEWPLFALAPKMTGPDTGCPDGPWVQATHLDGIFINSGGLAVLDSITMTVS